MSATRCEHVGTTLIKVCRVRDISVLEMLACFGVNFAGIHLIHSMDAQSLSRASGLCAEAHLLGIEPVLLTKLGDIDLITEALRTTGSRWLQLHSLWSTPNLSKLRSRLSDLGSIQTIHLITPSALMDQSYIIDLLELSDFLIADHRRGGTGRRVLPGLATSRVFAQIPPERVFLAGGLSHKNVADVIGAFRPRAVDVQTGVLGADGRQDPTLLREFVQAVRMADPPPSHIGSV